MPRMDCRIQPGVSTWFQPREPSTHGDAPQRGARTSIKTTYKYDVILYVAIARPCFGAHHFSPPKIECHSCSPPNSDRRCMPTKFVLRSDMIKWNGRTIFLIAPTVLHVWFVRFLGLSAQAVVFLRRWRLGKRAPTHTTSPDAAASPAPKQQLSQGVGTEFALAHRPTRAPGMLHLIGVPGDS
jgi:hypothetical protein